MEGNLETLLLKLFESSVMAGIIGAFLFFGMRTIFPSFQEAIKEVALAREDRERLVGVIDQAMKTLDRSLQTIERMEAAITSQRAQCQHFSSILEIATKHCEAQRQQKAHETLSHVHE